MNSRQLKDGYRRTFFWVHKLNKCVWRLPSEVAWNNCDKSAEFALRNSINVKCEEIHKLLEEYYGPRLAKTELGEIRAVMYWE